MFDYLEKFNQLPKSLKDKVSNPAVMAILDALDEKYHVELAPFVMKLMVKAMPANDLPLRLAEEFTIDKTIAETLAQELKDKVLSAVADYLDLNVTADPYTQKIAGVVNQIIAQVADFPNAHALADAIKMYLRGVRNMIDTKEALAKNFGLSFAQIEKLVGLMNTAKNSLMELPAKRPTGMLDKLSGLEKKTEAPYDLLKVLDTKHELESGLDLSHEIAAPKQEQGKSLGIPPKVGGTVSIIHELSKFDHEEKPVIPAVPMAPSKPKTEEPKPMAKKPETIAKPLPPVPVVKPVLPSRPAVRDVRQVKVMNPIDEIRFMDPVNFRRLGNTPAEMTAKIKARIDMLLKEDYQKGLAAMRSFRESPIGRMYLAIARYSLSQGVDLAKAVDLFKEQDKNSLTLAEMEAIMELNKNIN
ncbi:MAG TPA: hypothetical protein PKI61_02805 [bacterium]|nr:hypothetical protein [bacterium]HPT29840.1 hypothetical protein [bacterium]